MEGLNIDSRSGQGRRANRLFLCSRRTLTARRSAERDESISRGPCCGCCKPCSKRGTTRSFSWRQCSTHAGCSQPAAVALAMYSSLLGIESRSMSNNGESGKSSVWTALADSRTITNCSARRIPMRTRTATIALTSSTSCQVGGQTGEQSLSLVL